MNNTLIVCALKNELKVDEAKFKILYTGVGKINAAISLTKYISENNQIKNVINYGTAGSTKKEVGTLVDCTMFIQRDMDVSGLGFDKYMTPFDKKIPAIIDYSSFKYNPIKTFSICATGDSFINDGSIHVGDVVDMEAYALAKVCYVFKKNFISFKYISDGANNNAIKDWSKNIHQGEELFKSTILNNIN